MTTYEHQLAMWATQRNQRAQLNDDLLVPREVEHFAYFTRRGKAMSAADELTVAGFTVATGRRGFKAFVHASRSEPLSDDSVAGFLWEVITIVEKNGGSYDGWGATVQVTNPT